jgi:DNA mismatch endonuclease (patch repair protein)
VVDKISKQHRSWNMSRIKNRDTGPEMLVRKKLHEMGYRFRLHRKDLPGKPDIVLPKHKTIIFVHGCFWHRHPGCKYAYTPKTRAEFWSDKFENNTKRDQNSQAKLKEAGWQVGIIWECETIDPEILSSKLKRILLSTNGGV